MQGTQETMEATTATVASKVSIAGSAGSIAGWATSSNFGMWAGIVIGVTGLLVNWYYKRKSYRLEKDLNEARIRRLGVNSASMDLKGAYADE